MVEAPVASPFQEISRKAWAAGLRRRLEGGFHGLIATSSKSVSAWAPQPSFDRSIKRAFGRRLCSGSSGRVPTLARRSRSADRCRFRGPDLG